MQDRTVLNFRRYALFALAYTFVVVVWGAYVRATGSGAGCGDHWPTCNGQVLPRAASLQTAIEFTHRLMSGLALLVTAGLWGFARQATPPGHRARTGALWSLLFMLGEAAVGAALVLFRLVAKDESLARALVMPLHLVNTFLLTGALTLTVFWAFGDRPLHFRGRGSLLILSLGAMGSLMLVGASGAVAALGDTLFPAASVAEGLQRYTSAAARILLPLRLGHPLLALAGALCTAGFAWSAAGLGKDTRKPALAVGVLLCAQLSLGLLNVALQAPVWMQLIHLFTADALWVCLAWLSAAALALESPSPKREANLWLTQRNASTLEP